MTMVQTRPVAGEGTLLCWELDHQICSGLQNHQKTSSRDLPWWPNPPGLLGPAAPGPGLGDPPWLPDAEH